MDDARKTIDDLLAVMAALREPGSGCPWDLEQDFASIAPYTVEEAYEVADAIERRDMAHLREELGDLLLQVVYHAQMAREVGAFDFRDVVDGIARKMVRRHPHVFGDAGVGSAADLNRLWEEIKAHERSERGDAAKGRESVLDGVPLPLPALTRAAKLQRLAGRVGFEWPDRRPVLAKVREEIGELEEAIAGNAAPHALEDELGDILFALVNLARYLHVDPEAALRRTNRKFVRRFRRVEALLADRDRTPQESDLEEMDSLWNQAKAEERRREGDGAE